MHVNLLKTLGHGVVPGKRPGLVVTRDSEASRPRGTRYGSCSTEYVRDVRPGRPELSLSEVIANCKSSGFLRLGFSLREVPRG